MNMTASDNKNEARRGLFIKSKKLMLDQGEILYIESRAKKVEIHTVGALESIEIYATMEELEGQLGESFYRCHRIPSIQKILVPPLEQPSINRVW